MAETNILVTWCRGTQSTEGVSAENGRHNLYSLTGLPSRLNAVRAAFYRHG